jgi:RNA polymerase sigma factor (sigma-70 family)
LVLQDLRRTARLHDGAEQTDSQLLEAFRRSRDPLALEVLVRRHAPMVWGVCRRTLANHHEAEDAFQATFLVLLRKGVSIRTPELLPNWLYRVAYQTARKARQTAARRGSREKQVRDLPEPPAEPPADPCGLDLRDVLDEEVRRLPEKYRIAVVLCDLEGRTRCEAARQLRVPEGTVASRLATGRALLARRLLRRGFGASAVGLAAAGVQQAAPGAVPAALLGNTAKAVGLLAAGEAAAAGLISAEVSALADGVVRGMALAKLKTPSALLVLAALVLAGGIVACQALEPPAAPPRPAAPAPEAPKVAEGRDEVRCFAVGEWAWSVSFSPDGRQALIGTGGHGVPIRTCDLGSGNEAPRPFANDRWPRNTAYDCCWSAAYSPNGKYIAIGTGDGSIFILDSLHRVPLHGINFKVGRVRNVAFSPDGRLIAASHADGGLRLLEPVPPDSKTPARFKIWHLSHPFLADNDAVHSAAFTPDSKQVLVIDPDHTLRLYEVDSRREVRRFQGHTDRITDVAVSADGQRALSCGFDKTLRLWDLRTGEELRRLVGHEDGVHGVALCPDGRRALSCGCDKTLRLWDLPTARELHRFDGHEGAVVCVAASPDGQYALSGSSDHTVRLWRLPEAAPAPAAP